MGTLTMLHARADGGNSALPLIGLGDTADGLVHAAPWTLAYVWIAFALVVIVPSVALAHMNRVVANRRAVWNEQWPVTTTVARTCMTPRC